jgi:hypothetical protein
MSILRYKMSQRGTCRGQGARITSCGALTQVFGAKSQGGMGIVFPQRTLLV